MMRAAPGYPPECWAECLRAEQIAPLIAEMRAEFGANEPAKVMRTEGTGDAETVHLIDDPANWLSAADRAAPVAKFAQQNHGAVMPPEVATTSGRCSQCCRTGNIASVGLEGMGQATTVTPCAECLYDIAAGTQVLPQLAVKVETTAGPRRLWWDNARRTPVIVPEGPLQQELNRLAAELVAIGNADPHPFDEHYAAYLNKDRERTMQIGRRLYELGGLQLMMTVLEAVVPHLKAPAGRLHLDHAWHRVGEWRS
jgi:hypothetical protein